MLDGLGGLRACRTDDRHHVVRMVAARLLVERPLDVPQGRVRVPCAQRHRRRVDPLGGRLRAGWPLGRFALADPKVQPGAFDELPFLGIALEHLAERFGGGGVVVPLQPADAALVNRDRLVEAGFLRNRGGSGGGAATGTTATGLRTAVDAGFCDLCGRLGGQLRQRLAGRLRPTPSSRAWRIGLAGLAAERAGRADVWRFVAFAALPIGTAFLLGRAAVGRRALARFFPGLTSG